jgi:hypothetical protein
MSRRKKGAVRPGHGARCLICGRECGKGGSLKTHVEGAHSVDYNDAYKRCFDDGSYVLDEWKADDSGDLFFHVRVLKVPHK